MQRIRSKCLVAIGHVVASPFVHKEGRKWGTVTSARTRYLGPCETSRYIKPRNKIRVRSEENLTRNPNLCIHTDSWEHPTANPRMQEFHVRACLLMKSVTVISRKGKTRDSRTVSAGRATSKKGALQLGLFVIYWMNIGDLRDFVLWQQCCWGLEDFIMLRGLSDV
jgi:hypothetical protein